jgi:hypothetical protein
MVCENSYIADIGHIGILPHDTTYERDRITEFNENIPDPCPGVVSNSTKIAVTKECLGQSTCMFSNIKETFNKVKELP